MTTPQLRRLHLPFIGNTLPTPWKTDLTKTAGSPAAAMTSGGFIRLSLDATEEVQVARLSNGDVLPFDIDNIVLVDWVNQRREHHETVFEAVRTAGAARLRPILLTSLTTFGGLTPLLLEKSVQARFLVPMAVSLGFGVVFATLISLLLEPALYLVLEDVLSAFRWLYGARTPTRR